MAAKPPVLKPASNAFDFRIYHIDEAGTPDRVYHPHDPIATCIIKATNITRAMLKETTVRKSFEELARGYCKLRPNAWFLDGVRDAKAIEKILKKCTEDYLGSLETGWPAIVVPEKLKNPNCTAFSVRHAWHVKFEISEQILGLNAWRLNHMLGTAIVAQSSLEYDDLVCQDHRRFQFAFANAILHELTHIFYTYLTKGLEDTPLEQKALEKPPKPKNQGESGIMMEQLVFGGRVTFFRDFIVGSPDHTCGVPYLEANDGGVYSIMQETIDKTVNGDFEFPYKHGERDFKDTELAMMGRGNTPAEETESPRNHRAWSALLKAPFSPEWTSFISYPATSMGPSGMAR